MNIKEHLKNNPDIPLDKPESFLLDLSEIQNFAERISCFTFQAEFDDSISSITSKLDNMKRTCDVCTFHHQFTLIVISFPHHILFYFSF